MSKLAENEGPARKGRAEAGSIVVEKRPMKGGPAFCCSMCRKPIPVGGKVIRCSVSTCNSGKIKLVFCSPACWDSHLPDARHRSAYFVEEIARR